MISRYFDGPLGQGAAWVHGGTMLYLALGMACFVVHSRFRAAVAARRRLSDSGYRQYRLPCLGTDGSGAVRQYSASVDVYFHAIQEIGGSDKPPDRRKAPVIGLNLRAYLERSNV